MQCQCYKSKKEPNVQCPHDALIGSNFCGLHKTCNVSAVRFSKQKMQPSEFKQKAQPHEVKITSKQKTQPHEALSHEVKRTPRQKTQQLEQTPDLFGYEYMDDEMIKKVCQTLIDAKNYQEVSNLVRTNKRIHALCQPLLIHPLWSLNRTPQELEILSNIKIHVDISPKVKKSFVETQKLNPFPLEFLTPLYYTHPNEQWIIEDRFAYTNKGISQDTFDTSVPVRTIAIICNGHQLQKYLSSTLDDDGIRVSRWSQCDAEELQDDQMEWACVMTIPLELQPHPQPQKLSFSEITLTAKDRITCLITIPAWRGWISGHSSMIPEKDLSLMLYFDPRESRIIASIADSRFFATIVGDDHVSSLHEDPSTRGLLIKKNDLDYLLNEAYQVFRSPNYWKYLDEGHALSVSSDLFKI